MNSIFWKPKALRQLRKIEPKTNAQIRGAVTEELSDLASARNVKALTGHACGYRLRVGSYRVFFDFDGVVHVVTVEEVRKRDERTY
jgi:mRNA interferase RelE/StbE